MPVRAVSDSCCGIYPPLLAPRRSIHLVDRPELCKNGSNFAEGTGCPPQSPVNRSLMLRTEQNDRMNRMPAGVYYHECIICQLKLTKFCGLSFAGRQLGPR